MPGWRRRGDIKKTALIRKVYPLARFAHDKLMKLFQTYCLIGGMPEVVAHYSINKDLAALTPIYESLLVSYLDNVEKYANSGSQIEYIEKYMEWLEQQVIT
jgi:uncharacterized protein